MSEIILSEEVGILQKEANIILLIGHPTYFFWCYSLWKRTKRINESKNKGRKKTKKKSQNIKNTEKKNREKRRNKKIKEPTKMEYINVY